MRIVNSVEFNELKEKEKLVVDFFADWCGPCKMLGPVLEKVSEEYPDVEFVKVNVDDEMELAGEFGIMSIPAVFLFKKGEVVGQFLGFQQEKGIKEILDKTFK